MNFAHYNLGQKKGGEVVEINLQGGAANIRLMEAVDFANYQHGRRYKFYGGLAKRSPYRVQVPYAGHWHVAVDMFGLRGTVGSTLCVSPGQMPKPWETLISSMPSPLIDNEERTPEITKRT